MRDVQRAPPPSLTAELSPFILLGMGVDVICEFVGLEPLAVACAYAVLTFVCVARQPALTALLTRVSLLCSHPGQGLRHHHPARAVADAARGLQQAHEHRWALGSGACARA